MKLYDNRRAPNPRRVRWVMAEKGIEDVEIVPVDIMQGEHLAPDYLARVGMPHVPALELDDGTVITESLAICRYLESAYPEPNLFGRDAKETAVIEMWTRRVELQLATPLMLSVRHNHPALARIEKRQSVEFARVNREVAESALAAIDDRLARSEFVAGDRLTIADIVAVSGIDFGRVGQFQPAAGLAHVARWLDALRARPAAAAGA